MWHTLEATHCGMLPCFQSVIWTWIWSRWRLCCHYHLLWGYWVPVNMTWVLFYEIMVLLYHNYLSWQKLENWVTNQNYSSRSKKFARMDSSSYGQSKLDNFLEFWSPKMGKYIYLEDWITKLASHPVCTHNAYTCMNTLTHTYTCRIKQDCIAAAPCATQTVPQLPGTVIKAEN